MKTHSKLTLADANETFRAGLALLDAASGQIAAAGGLFASIPDSEWLELVGEAPPPMRRTLAYVRAVGEGRMIPELATASGEAVQRLRTLTLEDQGRMWREPVAMYAPGRVGRHAKYLRFVTEMTREEVVRAFARDGKGWRLRDYDEQRSYEAEMDRREVPEAHGVDRPGRWAIRNGRVYLAAAKASAGLSRRDIETIWKDLEDEA
jgi:hypothetical protein